MQNREETTTQMKTARLMVGKPSRIVYVNSPLMITVEACPKEAEVGGVLAVCKFKKNPGVVFLLVFILANDLLNFQCKLSNISSRRKRGDLFCQINTAIQGSKPTEHTRFPWKTSSPWDV